ncbi:MAG: class I SAM-dependent methyltransferase [Clostridiales bacterium]|nr:class I SAM-dependent methyltransferase [Clostridiales bacterium]
MDMEKIYALQNEEEQVKALYELFDEKERLIRSKSASVEFLTSVYYIEKYLQQGMKMLDIGAGSGEYSRYFADKGVAVTAVELSEKNIRDFREKITENMRIELMQGNALDLSVFTDESFDVVLLMGPLYHLKSKEDQQKCIREALRVLKKGGVIFFAFITHDIIFLTELMYNADYFKSSDFDHETMRLMDFPFVFHTIEEARKLTTLPELDTLYEIAVDGLAELVQKRIDAMDAESFSAYLRWHFMVCEKKEFLGASNHLLITAKKRQ